MAQQHPLWPTAMLATWALWVMWVAWQPGVWLWALPAALPLANLSPWTGWLAFEEFDLLVLGVLCALHTRRWLGNRPPCAPPPPMPRAETGLMGALWLLVAIGLALGASRVGAWHFNWFAAHEDPLWSLRASKGLAWALLLWPWMRIELAQAPRRSMHRVGLGMLLGLGVVSAVATHERLAYPGLYDFGSHYRTTALFWEMHVGGAAIDAYLAMATPFAAWGLWRAHAERHHALRWVLAGLLAVLATYACLTTFARGVYLAAGVSTLVLVLATYGQLSAQGRASRRLRRLAQGVAALAAAAASSGLLMLSLGAWGSTGLLLGAVGLLAALLGWLKWRTRHRGWRMPAAAVLCTVLLLEVMVVMGGDSFMAKRIEDGPADLDNRMTHWRQGLVLLREPVEWILGIGAGRFPGDYAASSRDREFSGRLSWRSLPAGATAIGGGAAEASGGERGVARLEGARHRSDLGGLYAATQRVDLEPGGPYGVQLTARSTQAAQLLIRVCERHLLYDRNCQSAILRLQPGPGWAVLKAPLRGSRLDAGSWWARRSGVFSAAVLQGPGALVEIGRVELFNPQGRDVLRNGDFSEQLAHWFPSAQRYYLPWHTDNLLLELLIERGLLGVLVFAALLCAALRALLRALPTSPDDGGSLAPALMASLAGMLCVGLVSSVLDAPRLSFLAFFLALLSLSLPRPRRPALQALRRPAAGQARSTAL